MRILLSGGTGFLGSALARHWAGCGHSVTVLVRAGSSLKRLEPVLPLLSVARMDEGRNLAALVEAAAPEAVVHTACAYGRSGETALQLFDSNVAFGMRLLDTVLCAGSSRVTFLNTGTVLDAAVSAYALGKRQFAEWGELVAKQNGERLRFVNVRLQHMFGPGDDPSKFTTHVVHACRRSDPRLVLTPGEQQRDLIYIDDVVSAYDVLLRRSDELALTDVIDVGSGTAPTIRSFVETAHKLTGSRTQLVFGGMPYRANEPMYCRADIARLEALGWRPSHTLEQGVRKMIDLEFES